MGRSADAWFEVDHAAKAQTVDGKGEKTGGANEIDDSIAATCRRRGVVIIQPQGPVRRPRGEAPPNRRARD